MAFGGHSEFPEALKHQLVQEGFDVDLLQSGIEMESSEFTTTAPPVLRRLAQETHNCTWFTLSQHDCGYQTHRGSRPGSPLADLAYNVMMRNALLQLTHELEEEPVLQHAHQVIGFRCPPLAWVDDEYLLPRHMRNSLTKLLSRFCTLSIVYSLVLGFV